MARFSWGSQNRDSAYIGPYGGLQWVTSAGIGGFPGGNYDRFGNRQVYLAGINPTYASGPSYWRGRIYLDGAVRYSGQVVTNPSGTFNFDIEYSGGQLRYGRQVGAGYGIGSSNAGTQWSNDLLTGYIDWATVSQAPGTPSVTSVPGGQASVSWSTPGWNGDSNLTQYRLEWSPDGGNWVGGVEGIGGNSYTVSGLTPGRNWYFRVSAANGVGWSGWSGVGGAFIRSGGQRWSGSAFVPQRVRRWNGSAWLDQRVRRWNGSAWVDVR